MERLEDIISARNGAQENGPDVVLVLGAGIASWLSRQRAKTASRFAKYLHDTIIMPTGGKGGLFSRLIEIPEAVQMRGYLIDDGVKEEKIVVEPHAVNTHDNIQKSKLLIDKINPKTVYIVTNKAHMPRALKHARNILRGYEVVPLPTNPKWYEFGEQFNEFECLAYEKTKIPMENFYCSLKTVGKRALEKVYNYI